jgi:hypothetical protein
MLGLCVFFILIFTPTPAPSPLSRNSTRTTANSDPNIQADSRWDLESKRLGNLCQIQLIDVKNLLQLIGSIRL